MIRFAPRECRRGAPRVAITERIEVHCADDTKVISCASLDIGMGGVCVHVPDCFQLDAIEAVSLTVGREELLLSAKGIWQRERAIAPALVVGIAFTAVDARESGALWKLVNRRAFALAGFLAGSPALSGIDFDIAMDIALRTRRRPFQSSEYAYRQGETDPEDRSIYVVAAGEVELLRDAGEGELLSLGTASQGEIIGGLPLIAGIDPIDSAISRESVELLEIDEYAYESLRNEKPVVARHLTCAVVRRLLCGVETLSGR